jgi:hypothetical protein
VQGTESHQILKKENIVIWEKEEKEVTFPM